MTTEKKIECILYGVAEKQKIGLDMEKNIEVAKNELLHLWTSDMSQIEQDANRIN
jgi:hypothetical protein